MTTKLQDGYRKKNAMHVNPKHKWCVKKIFGQKLKNWKFFNFDQSSINRALIKSGRIKPKILSQFRSVKNQRRSIKNLEKWIFEKQSKLMQKLLKAHCIMNKMHEYELKSFSKTLEFNPDLPKQVFQSNCPKKSNIKHILHQNQWAYNLGWPQQDHTQYNVQSLAKSNLCSVCN